MGKLRAYGPAYQRARAQLLAPDANGNPPPCHWCGDPATTADHDPPLEEFGGPHLNLVPACGPCNFGRRNNPKEPAKVHRPSREW